MFKEDILKALPMSFAGKDLSCFVGGVKDDCAGNGGRNWALSANAFVEGNHFPPDATPEEVAGKVLVAGLSNLAGSACRPRWAMVSLCIGKGLDGAWAMAFSRELEKKAAEFDVGIGINDVVTSKNTTSVMVTVAGEPLAGGPIPRGCGNYDDVLVVTGELGGSEDGRHSAPVPRYREIQLLMDFCAKNQNGPNAFPTAIAAISDGLATDLFLMCHDSKTGAVVEADKVPISSAAAKISMRNGRTALEHALNDGEDYELLIALPPPVWEAFKTYLASPEGAAAAAGLAPFTRVGNLSSVLHLRLRLENGTMTHLHPMGSVSYKEKLGADDAAADAKPSASNIAPSGKGGDAFPKESRIAALRMIASGHKPAKVAKEFRVSEETVHEWVRECGNSPL